MTAPTTTTYNLTGRPLKVVLVLDPKEIAEMKEPTTSRVTIRAGVGGQVVNIDIASKALRKAQATIREHGIDGVNIIVQGKMEHLIADAGLVATPKTKPAAAPAPAETAAA
jgi:hypothetical protein